MRDRDQSADSRDAKALEQRVLDMRDKLFPEQKQPSWPRRNAEDAWRKWRFE